MVNIIIRKGVYEFHLKGNECIESVVVNNVKTGKALGKMYCSVPVNQRIGFIEKLYDYYILKEGD